MRLTALLCALALAAAPAAAQAPPGPLVDPDAVLVEELVVTAIDPGPAWWRVSDTDTTVYVLGVPALAPKGLAWDSSVLERRLEGANRVILPFNEASVNLLTAPGALINLMRLRDREPYEAKLPPGLAGRFLGVRAALGQPPERYRVDNGLAAALLLLTDYRDHASLTAADPAKTIRRMAEARKLRTITRRYDAGPLLGSIIRTPEAAQRACLAEAIAEVERGPAPVRAAGRAWAEGDVRGALAVERGYEVCIAAAPGAAAFDARFKADQAAAIVEALREPGHAVAVVQLRPLLSQGGVLDRLRSRGFDIRTPGDR